MTKDIKNNATKDWQSAFPQLVKYAQNKYYKILGSLLIGIEFVKLPKIEHYRPYFVIYSLWGNKDGNDLKACLSTPIILKEFFSRKDLQYSIPYIKHDSEFSSILKSIKKQLPFPMEGDVSLKTVFSVFDEYSRTPPLSAAPNSYLQAELIRSKLKLAVCFGNEKQIQNIFNQIKKRKWDLEHFAAWNIKYDEWLKIVEKEINNKTKFLTLLNANKQNKKLEKLKESKLKE